MTHNSSFNKNNILEPKLVEINKEYTFTLNPSDKYQYWDNTMDDRIKKSVDHCNKILRTYGSMKVKLHMDFSRTGRIHWHGTIRFPSTESIKIFYLKYFHELQEEHQIEMDTIEDIEKWNEYCTKLKHLVDEVCTTESSSKLMRELYLGSSTVSVKYKRIDEY